LQTDRHSAIFFFFFFEQYPVVFCLPCLSKYS
jgi:hypothetical protein